MSSRIFNRKLLAHAVATTLAAYSGATLANPTAGSSYFTDVQNTHVEDATSKGIGTVNMIACILHALAPDQLVNKGDYVALVDENTCDPNSRDSSSQSGSSSGSQTSYTTTFVNSSRASNSDPMIVKVWLNEDHQGQAMTIFVHVSATAAPTSTNPYGVFRLDFCGHADNATDSSCLMKGYLDASDGALSFYQDEQGGGGGGGASTTALRLTSVGTNSGSGKLSSTQTDNNTTVTETFAFAYDQNLFLRGDQCFTRDASDPGTGQSVWSYGMYDATTGARINLNSGFPIQYTSSGTTYQGFLGYWGLSLQPGSPDLANGATIEKVDYSSGNNPTTTNYTVVKSAGKLTKYTRKSTTLDKLDQITINTWINDATGFFSGATANSQYELHWDNAAGNFVVTGQVSCGNNGCQSQDLPSPQNVPVSYFVSHGGGLQGFANSLGGDLFISFAGVSGAVDSTTITVNYRVQDIVYPADMPATLYCVNNCPTAASLNAYFSASSHSPGDSPFTSTTFNNWNPTTAVNVVTYSSDVNNAVLDDGVAAAVTYTNATALQSDPMYGNGIRTGRLFTSLATAECSPGSGTYCDYKVNDADVYYQWETGSNNWNQFAAVKDSGGNIVKFDAPLQVNYVVPNDATLYHEYAGKTIVLQYGGFGNLWGIPGTCVSRLTNQPLTCNDPDARYVPDFAIPMSDTTGVATAGSTTYLIKWLDREIRFASKSLSTCAALTAPSNVTLPDASGLQNPADSASSDYIGTKPAITSAPRVIQGDVKY